MDTTPPPGSSEPTLVGGGGPAVLHPEPAAPALDEHGRLIERTPCFGCGYDLRGLPRDGACPECGMAVDRSLHGDQLVFANTEYVGGLRRGTGLILASVVVVLVITAVSIISGVVVGVLGGGTMPMGMTVGLSMLNLLAGAIGLVGWWMLTTPDPGYEGREDPTAARRVVRATVIAQAVMLVANLVLQFAFPSLLAGMSTPGGGGGAGGGAAVSMVGVGLVAIALGLVGAAVQITHFFASMLYVRWLAPRLPDEIVHGRARKYMWLLPVIFVVGSCLVVGPLVALAMYYLLLLRVHRDLGRVIEEQRRAGGATTVFG